MGGVKSSLIALLRRTHLPHHLKFSFWDLGSLESSAMYRSLQEEQKITVQNQMSGVITNETSVEFSR